MYEAVKFFSNYCFNICKMTVETMKNHSDILVNRTEQIPEFGFFLKRESAMRMACVTLVLKSYFSRFWSENINTPLTIRGWIKTSILKHELV